MASLFDIDSSSDSSDEDYVPDGNVTSDEEPIRFSDEDESPEKEGVKKNSKKLNRKSSDSVQGKTIEESKKTLPVDEKQKADDLFKNFLEEVAVLEGREKSETTSNSLCSESTTSLSPVETGDSGKLELGDSSRDSPCVNAAENRTEEYDFAGETVVVTSKNKNSSILSEISGSTEAEKSPAATHTVVSTPVQAVKRKGLHSVLNIIQNKKPKLTTLQKSHLDWAAFKKEEGIEEDLEIFNKGKGGYLERKRFLERSDVRSFEMERDMRLSRVKKT